MAFRMNDAAVRHGRALIDQGRYRINSNWRMAEPDAEQICAFLTQAGDADAAPWFLAQDEAQPGAQGMKYPIGDFRSVHRSALQAARRQAEAQGEAEIAEAARELIDWIDHYNAC
jgi:NADH pyrophosphatase NudC (nudix superfamily)